MVHPNGKWRIRININFMDERKIDILEAAIREFITSGEPVSSSTLFDRYEFGIKPAMIRHELNELTEGGFLEQPYHSSGRVPTDEGYEFFADRAFLNTSYAGRLERELRAIYQAQSWPGLAAWISGALHGLGVVCSEGNVYKEGLERVFERLEWERREEIKQIIRDYEELDGRLERALESAGEESRGKEKSDKAQEPADVYIGRKSPLTKSERLAVVTDDYRIGNEHFVVCFVGPKRLDYERAAAIFRALRGVVDRE